MDQDFQAVSSLAVGDMLLLSAQNFKLSCSSTKLDYQYLIDS